MDTSLTDLASDLKPFILKWLQDAGYTSSKSSATNTSQVLTSTQYPDALLKDGSRALTGNLPVAGGVTIDGVDISEFAATVTSALLPTTITPTSSNNVGGGTHTHAVDKNAAWAWNGGHTFSSLIGTPNFASGFSGYGWRADNGIATNGQTTIEVDNLIVRNRMNVYELLANRVRATNGNLFVASSGKASQVTGSAPYVINTEAEHGFAVDDIIRAQKFSGASVYKSDLRVTAINSTTQFSATLVSGNAPSAGYEYVRLGNATNANRQGAVYLTSDDSNAPFIDITDGVTSHAEWDGFSKVKIRAGKLSGITDSVFGSLLGYGLYSQAAYLRGRLATELVAGLDTFTAHEQLYGNKLLGLSQLGSSNGSYPLLTFNTYKPASATYPTPIGFTVRSGTNSTSTAAASLTIHGGDTLQPAGVYISGQLSATSNGLTGTTIKSATSGVGVFANGSQLSLTSSVFSGGLGFQIGANNTGVIQAYSPSTENGTLLLNPIGGVVATGAGNVGIGTQSPSSQLHVSGGSSSASNISSGFLTMSNTSSSNNATAGIAFKTNWEAPAIKAAILASNLQSWGRSDIRIALNGAGDTSNVDPIVDTKVIIKNSGYVGIGTTSPQRLLDVNGAMRVAGTIYDSTAVGARVVSTTAQSIPNAQETAVSLNSAIVITDSNWSSGAPTKMYAQRAGFYSSTGAWGMDSANNTVSAAITTRIRKNGSVFVGARSDSTLAGKYWVNECSASMFWMNAGDYIELMAYHEQGGARNTWTADANNEAPCVLTLSRIS